MEIKSFQLYPSDTEKDKKYLRTMSALDILKNSFRCRTCSLSSQELFSLGQCEHRFCQACSKLNKGKPCPVCEIPAYATLAHIDKQLSSIAQLCSQMSHILEGRPLSNDENQVTFQPSENKPSLISSKDDNPDFKDSLSNTVELQVSKNGNVKKKEISSLKNTEEIQKTNLITKSNPYSKKTVTLHKENLSEATTSLKDKVLKGTLAKNEDLVSNLDTSTNVTPNKSKNAGRRKSNLMKRNAKGETLLQVATIKADVETVKRLLEEGANPNVKDYAGWTPLHEAVNHGNSTIAGLLIHYGAAVNAPGLNNDTPLHDAVSNYHRDCIQLLVSSGANIMARNLQGQTPLDLASSNETKEILLTANVVKDKQPALNTSLVAEGQDTRSLCFTGTALSKDNQKLLEKVANLFDVKFVDNFTSEVTHLITGVNAQGRCPRTLKYLTSILGGKWVVKSEWLKVCLESKTLVAEEDFEIVGCSSHPDSESSKKGRLNKAQQLPGLFDGCQFYFLGKFSHPSREEIISLVKLGGGVILTREPRLHNLDDYPYTIPYHSMENSTLADCSIFVIYDDACPNPPHVEAQRMAYLPLSWLLDSIATFTLLDKTSYVKK